MTYRRFKLAELNLPDTGLKNRRRQADDALPGVAPIAGAVMTRAPATSQTVANVATVAGVVTEKVPASHQTVANVARVAAADPAAGGSSTPTVANVATVAAANPASEGSQAQSVATVATVAGPFARDEVHSNAPIRGSGPATFATLATLQVGEVGVPAILRAYDRLLLEGHARDPEESMRVVRHFLEAHWDQARVLGWAEVELFGCHPQPAFAVVRYDCMGAVTIAASMNWPIAAISTAEIRCMNGLASRRKSLAGTAAVVWEVFSVGSM